MKQVLDVYLDGGLVGHLSQDAHGLVAFAYAKTWLADPRSMPLSRSLPLRDKPFSRNECVGFFAGILPEEGKRSLVARNLGVSANNDFALLDKIGGECAGAVTFLPAGQSPSPRSAASRRGPGRFRPSRGGGGAFRRAAGAWTAWASRDTRARGAGGGAGACRDHVLMRALGNAGSQRARRGGAAARGAQEGVGVGG